MSVPNVLPVRAVSVKNVAAQDAAEQNVAAAEPIPFGSAALDASVNLERLPTRIVALDVLRGITVALMILVNNGGDGSHTYWPLKHADWNGWTPTDLVFPTFVFLMGTAIVFSTEARLRRGDSRSSLLLHTVRRFAILFLLGIVVNGFPLFQLHTLRIYGVLQRIAICFLIGSILYLWDRRASTKIVLAVTLLLGYWILLRWVPVPGLGMPGRDIPFMDKTANLTSYIDRLIFPPSHLFLKVRDPEGLLSNLPAIASTLLGMLTGLWLRSRKSANTKAAGMLGAGILGIVLGQLWNIWFPINKNLWTSSFVLLAAGWTLVAFALCYWAVEGKSKNHWWTVVPFVFGMNTITAYVFSELLYGAIAAIRIGPKNSQQILYAKLFGWIYPHEIGSLLYAIAYVAVCCLPVYLLYRRKIFIKV